MSCDSPVQIHHISLLCTKTKREIARHWIDQLSLPVCLNNTQDHCEMYHTYIVVINSNKVENQFICP